MEKINKLSNNSISVIALANEYCQLIEHAAQCNRDMFVAQMLKILPRLYISISDVEIEGGYGDYYIEPVLDELVYDQARNEIAMIMAEEDIYLEVFVEDMKYSDTPISASVSENLADLYQELFNFVQSVKGAPALAHHNLIEQCKENFINYWGQTLCNVLRALNTIFYNTSSQDY